MTLLLFGPTRRHAPCTWHGTHRVAPPGAGRFSTSFFGRAIWPRQGFGTKGVPWQLCPGGLNQTDVIQAFSRKTHVGNTRKCWQKIGNGPSQIKNKMMPHRSHKKGVLGFRWLEILKEFLEGRFDALFNIATSMPPKFNSPPPQKWWLQDYRLILSAPYCDPGHTLMRFPAWFLPPRTHTRLPTTVAEWPYTSWNWLSGCQWLVTFAVPAYQQCLDKNPQPSPLIWQKWVTDPHHKGHRYLLGYVNSWNQSILD